MSNTMACDTLGCDAQAIHVSTVDEYPFGELSIDGRDCIWTFTLQLLERQR